MMLQVQCPNDGDKCLVSDCDIKEEMVLLGDEEQNMQCTNCGYASNKDYKDKMVEFPEDFQSVCKEFGQNLGFEKNRCNFMIFVCFVYLVSSKI